ncbi:translation initiation factor IF-2-like [Zalophus californianus]|uniref:Translation initiation factor IF-2-like n=1 Tax=Zalophus californianus TaxID=9704 RepID=A0A6J2DIL7_ZALCA|nr:translation initiation factor IF-2-like [Zalophus californianus]
MTQHKARPPRGSREARATPSGAGPAPASGHSPLLPPTSNGSAEPPPDPDAAAQGGRPGARRTPLGPCETTGADARLRLGARGILRVNKSIYRCLVSWSYLDI